MTTRNADGHALVVGGSIAGLIAARVLADRFKGVTLIERDRFPDGPRFRKGVPQSRHLHVFMPRERRIAERLFPAYVPGTLRKGMNAGFGEEDRAALVKGLRAGDSIAGVRDRNQIGS